MIVFEKGGVTETVGNVDRERYLEAGWRILKEGVSRPMGKGRYDKSGSWQTDAEEKERDRLRVMGRPELVKMLRGEIAALEARIAKLERDKPA